MLVNHALAIKEINKHNLTSTFLLPHFLWLRLTQMQKDKRFVFQKRIIVMNPSPIVVMTHNRNSGSSVIIVSPASKVLLFFKTCFFCATSSTESCGETRTTSCYPYAYFCAAMVLQQSYVAQLFLLPFRLLLCYCNASFSATVVYASLVQFLLTYPIPTQIKQPSTLSNNYHCVSNSSIHFPLLTVALPFFAGQEVFSASVETSLDCIHLQEAWYPCEAHSPHY